LTFWSWINLVFNPTFWVLEWIWVHSLQNVLFPSHGTSKL
jgi:hypothetical protein